LTLIAENNSITAKSIAFQIGISIRKVEAYILKIKQKDLLQRIDTIKLVHGKQPNN